jgi:hypothetical protein
MNILVTNDDGVCSDGIKTVTEALSGIGKVTGVGEPLWPTLTGPLHESPEQLIRQFWPPTTTTKRFLYRKCWESAPPLHPGPWQEQSQRLPPLQPSSATSGLRAPWGSSAKAGPERQGCRWPGPTCLHRNARSPGPAAPTPPCVLGLEAARLHARVAIP